MKKKHSKMVYIKDEHGHELLLKDDKVQVMMEWAKPYMKACIDALEPHGDVLEVGFGCGYAAEFIQQYHPKSHTIIEYHPQVAQKAREWAKGHSGVTVIQDTWQNALDTLGVFDTIFFDDNPIEIAAEAAYLEHVEEAASSLLQKGKKILKRIRQKFSFLQDLKYQDKDLDYFFAHLKDRASVDKTHFLPFFYDLKIKGNITDEQFQAVIKRLETEGLITAMIRSEFLGKMHRLNFTTFEGKPVERFFEFFQKCVEQHMRKGSKFSCALDCPTSKFEDEEFFNHVITNPSLDFQERFIPVEVPQHCLYYPYKEALVIVITKRC